MSDDLWGFFIDVSSNEGYIVEGSYCIGNECSSYVGNIDQSNIWKFNLHSKDGDVVKSFEASVTNLLEPRICLSVDSSGKKIDFDISPKNWNITKDGLLCIDGNSQDHKLKLLIKKILVSNLDFKESTKSLKED